MGRFRRGRGGVRIPPRPVHGPLRPSLVRGFSGPRPDVLPDPPEPANSVGLALHPTCLALRPGSSPPPPAPTAPLSRLRRQIRCKQAATRGPRVSGPNDDVALHPDRRPRVTLPANSPPSPPTPPAALGQVSATLPRISIKTATYDDTMDRSGSCGRSAATGAPQPTVAHEPTLPRGLRPRRAQRIRCRATGRHSACRGQSALNSGCRVIHNIHRTENPPPPTPPPPFTATCFEWIFG